MRIAFIVEGDTERAFQKHLRNFLQTRLSGRMPKLLFRTYRGKLVKPPELKKMVDHLLRGPNPVADEVIVLTDVYTGKPDFEDAADAKRKMREWVGREPRFHPHAAQYEFEAWLLPYRDRIKELSKANQNPPSSSPENVNHNKPPSHHLDEMFRTGRKDKYIKPRDASRILDNQDLVVAADACPELKSLLNTILQLSGGESLP